MKAYVKETIDFFEDLLQTKNIVIESRDFCKSADEYCIDKYLTKKTLYFNKQKNVLTALCPVNSSSLKYHNEIVKLESNVNFRWIVKGDIKNERFYDCGIHIDIIDKDKLFITTKFF